MFALRISETGAAPAIATLSRVARAVDDAMPVWPSVIRALHEIEKRQFDSEGSAGRSGKWHSLDARYREWKDRHFPGGKILQRTGRLMDSLAGQTGDSITEATRHRLVFGSRVPYGVYHQAPGMAKHHRPPISLTNRHAFIIAQFFHRYVHAASTRREFSGQIPLGV